MKIGIVGLPNVGKSTLFNALTRSSQAEAQNYPFCTIDPNVGVVDVPDNRLTKLSEISHSQKTIPTVIEFVDIAGLVKGAAEGEGLGNQFLSHIREVDAIAHVVRDFKNDDIIHVSGKIDPQEDRDIINMELALADLSTVNKSLDRVKKAAKGVAAKEAAKQVNVIEKVHAWLEQGKAVRDLGLAAEEFVHIRELHLLTAKPMLYVLNVDESGTPEIMPENSVAISAQLEAELAALSPEDAQEYMRGLGMNESGLDKLVRAGYELLGLLTFFTSGEKETRAWTVKAGSTAPQAAGRIHTDFEKGFIKAEVISYDDFVACNGELGAKEKGKLRIEGKEYVVQDGDVCHFRFNK